MRLSETRPVARSSGLPPRAADQPEPAVTSASRALTVVTPVAANDRDAATCYRPAAFLAQLIAMKDQHPQTRERRRAEPDEALAAYRAAANLIVRR